MHLDDAVDLVVLHVRHGDIVAEQKGKPLVVILEIKALAHSGRQLVDEAEHTFITAGAVFTHQSILEFNSKFIVVLFIDFQKPFFPGRLADQDFDIFIFHQITFIFNSTSPGSISSSSAIEPG